MGAKAFNGELETYLGNKRGIMSAMHDVIG